MTENQFDEFFRKKLGDYSSPVPEDMWRRIKQRKDKERRTLLILLLLLLMVGGTTSYFIFERRAASQKENTALSQKQTNPSTNNSTQNKNQKQTIATQDSTTSSQENKISSLNNETEKSSEPGLNKNNNSKTNESKSTKISNSVIKNNVAKTNREKNLISKNSTDEMNKTGREPIEQNLEQPKNNQANEVTKQNEVAKPGEQVIAEQNNQNNLSSKDSSQKKLQNNAASKEIIIKTHSPIIKNLFVEVYASPDIPVNKISSNNADYLRHKDSTSQMKLSYTFGVRIGAALGEHFTVKTGFQYSDINEKFNYLNKNATRTVPVVITRTLTNSSGETMMLLDTSNLIQAGKDYKLSYNHYKSIDIPILIGYETNGERLKAAFNTGIILNIKTSYKGEILDASLNAADINSYNIYKNNTGVSLYFGLGVSTKLNDNFRLFTEPYVRYRLNSMTGTRQSFSQKINVGGLSLGLRYNF